MKRLRLFKWLCVVLCCIFLSTALVACVPNNPPETPPTGDKPHFCSKFCSDCGGCLDEDCNEIACQRKCSKDHQIDDEHTCESECLTCGKCKNMSCVEKACKDKCTCESGEKHECSQPCPKCGGCLDENCDKTSCQHKCDCAEDDPNVDSRYGYSPVISDVMPIVRINTDDNSNAFATVPNRDSKLNGEIEYVGATITIEDGDKIDVDNVAAKVKARGNYTLQYEKKPIRIKFDKKQSVLGLNGGAKFKSWVLLADWKDLSMTNNSLAFYLGNTILGSDGYYTSDFRNVEVYLNGQYWGVYLLAEQQEAKGDDGRTSAPAVEDNYTGTDIGYFVEYDGYYADENNMPNGKGDPTFELNYNNFATLRKLDGSYLNLYDGVRGYTVKSDIYADAQLNFIQRYMNYAYTIAYEAVYNKTYLKFNDDYSQVSRVSDSSNVTTKSIVSSVIDVQSLVDTYILSEIACDPDIAWSSFYISLDMTATGSKKLIFEAPWDYDSAFGIKAGYVNNGYGMYAANNNNPWIVLLINEDWFQEMIRAKWSELIENGVHDNAIELVLTQKTVYEQYYAKNYQRWSNRIYYGDGELLWELNSYSSQGQAADYLYKWLSTRIKFLSTQWSDGSDIGDDIPSMPEEGTTRYRFEAEDCWFSDPIVIDDWHSELASNGYFLGQINGWYDRSIVLTVYVEQDCTAFLSVGLSKRSFSAYFGDWFYVRVNDQLLDIPPRYIPACGDGETEWVAWTDVYLMPIELKAGYNTIVFTTLGTTATNVDYFELWSDTTITSV